jgi:hypothetical protein
MIKLLRKCRWCDDGVGKVNGEFVHVHGNYCCRNKDSVAE